jgi:chemotaxis response regulator CheB
MSTAPIRLVLAGSDVRLREQVHAVVATRPQMLLVSEVTCGEDAIAVVAECAPDVLVLDMQNLGRSCLQRDAHGLNPAAAAGDGRLD